MYKYDDFDLDLQNVKANKSSQNTTPDMEVKCITVRCSVTCVCPKYTDNCPGLPPGYTIEICPYNG